MIASALILLGALSASLTRSSWRRVVIISALAAAVVATWRSDALGAVVGTTTVIVGGIVTLFAMRQFDGERRGQYLPALMLLCVAAATAMSVSRSFAHVVVAWVATSVATISVLFVATPRRSRRAVWRAALTLGLSDVSLVVTTLLVLNRHDGVLAAATLTERTVLYVAIVLAAGARAGLTWRRSWVTDTVVAPTAVSALLHAGVVNAGALLIIRAADSVPVVSAVTTGAAIVAAVSLVSLAPRIHRRHDLKGQLATSTVSQMAFMLIMVCLGWPLLAVTHMVGHAAYKAYRFVTAAGATESRARRRTFQPGGQVAQSWLRVLGALALGVLTISFLLAVAERDARTALGIFGVAAIAAWWRRSASAQRAPFVTWGLCAALGVAYPLSVELFATFVDQLPRTGYLIVWWAPAVLLAITMAYSRQISFSPISSTKESHHATV